MDMNDKTVNGIDELDTTVFRGGPCSITSGHCGGCESNSVGEFVG
jgi:hypothetical protein